MKGIIFDYGATIDTNGIHWAEVLWRQYVACGVPVEKEQFREAYVYGERTMALQPLVKPEDGFRQVLWIKCNLQWQYLVEKGWLDAAEYPVEKSARLIAEGAFAYARETVGMALKIVEKLKKKHKLVLVSNFYGNIHAVLKEFGLLCSFEKVIESSVVGVRKPDPAIFALGVEAMGYAPEEIVVVGDSYAKDMVPAHKVGCKTVWLKGIGWEKENEPEWLPDAIIHDLAQLPEVIEKMKN